MFELPELVTLASQANATLRGRTVTRGSLGNRPHKFVWYNRTPEAFAELTAGRRIGTTTARGRWLFMTLEPGYVLLLGEFGGRMLLHPAPARLPAGYHLSLELDDGSALTVTTSMWGAMELYEAGAEQERQYVRGMRPTPLDPDFTPEYLDGLIEEQLAGPRRTAKGLLTQDQLVPGLGNSIAQDILFVARLHPRHSLADLDHAQRRALHAAILSVVGEAIARGGRSDEVDLHGDPGGYVRHMAAATAGRPCPGCGTRIERIQYLGGACYLCPACQR